MPGACAKGRPDKRPISTVPIMAEIAVVMYIAP